MMGATDIAGISVQQTLDLWRHYEEIAMHFNELIIQYRLQLMGGAGAIGGILAYLGSKIDDISRRHSLRAWLSTGLLVILFAAAYLDLGYYNKLLRGAVDALILIEKTQPELYISTMIENRFNDRFPFAATPIIYFAYLMILVPLILTTRWSWRVVNKERSGS